MACELEENKGIDGIFGFSLARRPTAALPEALAFYCGGHDYGTQVCKKNRESGGRDENDGTKDVRTAMQYQHPNGTLRVRHWSRASGGNRGKRERLCILRI